ncbi:hypothetical protein DM49_3395 [Burkholderia mallei]|nr:hypothetical protein DM75_3550 [Burkholderia mallei]KOS90333.1 hypothetical protein DM49_3395 [Burkholderia mallei]KOT00426.1 hypothetical protein DM50_2936 [Burkholderia mallei]
MDLAARRHAHVGSLDAVRCVRTRGYVTSGRGPGLPRPRFECREKRRIGRCAAVFDGRLLQSENPRIACAARGFFVRRVGGAGYLAALTI